MTTADFPTGTVTFLVSDVEGSGDPAAELGPGYRAVRELHRSLVRDVVGRSRGIEVAVEGDISLVVFASAEDAVACAVNMQRAFVAYDWPQGRDVRVRVGLHTGEARLTDGDYGGTNVRRAQNIARSGHGGQILMSATTAALIERDLPRATMLRDHGSHELKDLAYPEHLYQLVVEGLPEDFPALRTLSAQKTNLAKRANNFLGRVDETLSLADAILDQRLVTLAGPAGIGKSSLAIEVASRIIDSFADGVWLIDVSRVGDESLLASAVAKELNITESGPPDLVDRIVRRLLGASTLLILDGCEHLVEAVGRLAQSLLSSTSNVRLVVTSRQPLTVTGERLVRIAPLSTPPRSVLGVDDLLGYESVALFVDRAKGVKPGFEFTADVAPFVAEICRRLDGLPLAMELAAAQISELSVREIANRLDRRMPLGSRDPLVSGGGQTLEATLDWSYDSLNPEERTLFARLSVFAGGFTRDSAEAVCAGEPLTGSLVGPILDRLVESSLVLASRPDPGRYRLLEPIGRYARGRLAQGTGLDDVQQRHASFFLEVAEKADPKLRGPEQVRSAAALDLERYNLRAALRWSKVYDTETSLRLAGALRWFWVIQRDVTEGATWLRGALADRGAASPEVVAQALHGVGLLAFRALDLGTAGAAIAEALNIYEQLDDVGGIARQTYHLAILSWFLDDHETAGERLDVAEVLCNQSGERWYLAWTLAVRGTIARTSDSFEDARRSLNKSHDLFSEVGGKIDMGWSYLRLGALARDQGLYEQAAAHYAEGRVLLSEHGDEIGLAHADAGLGALGWLKGNQAQALSLFANVIEAFGSSDDAANNLFELKMMIQGDPSVAELKQVAQWNRERAGFEGQLGVKAALAEYLYHLGKTASRQGHVDRAQAALRESFALSREAEDFRGVVVSLIHLGCVLSAKEDPERALTLFAAASSVAAADSLEPWPPADEPDYQRHVENARRVLGVGESDRVWRTGTALSLKDVTAQVRALVSGAVST